MRWLAWAGRLGLIALCAIELLTIRDPGLSVAALAVARGDAAVQSGHFTQAIPEFEAALQAQSGDPSLIERLANTAALAQRPDIAIIYLRQLATLRGWSPPLYGKIGDMLALMGDRWSAISYWRASLTGTKNDLPTLKEIADFALADRDWDGGLALLKQIIAIDSADAQALYQAGMLLAPTDARTAQEYFSRAAADLQYRASARLLINAIDLHIDDGPAALSSQIGVVLMGLKAWAYAEHAFAMALSRGSNAPITLAFYGLAQDQQGRDGQTSLERAATLAPNDPVVLYAMALHWRLKGNPDRAMDTLQAAMLRDPRNPAIAAEIGTVRRIQGRISEAASWLNLAVNLAPTNAEFLTLLATFYADEGYNLTDEGLPAIRKIVAILPDSADAHASLGRALFLTGQFGECRQELEKALILDATNVRAHYYHAIFLEYAGDRQGAIEDYLYAARDMPGNTFRDLALRALTRLNIQPGEGVSTP